MTDTPAAPGVVELAAITGAHGIGGEVRLKLFGEGIEALAGHNSFNGGALTLRQVRSDNKGGGIARFAESTNRNDAEKLRGTVLTVPREALPQLDADEYYHTDLIGLPVVTDTDHPVGTVIAVQNFGATDIIEIERDPPPAKGMATFMVPMTEAAVMEWNSVRIVIASGFAEE